MWRSVRRDFPMRFVALLCLLALVIPLGTLSAFAESAVAQSEPYVVYVFNWDSAGVEGFLPHAALVIEVDDPDTRAAPDHTLDLLTDSEGDAWFGFDFEARPGFTITATVDTTTRTLMITYVEVTVADLESSVVWGMAEPLAM